MIGIIREGRWRPPNPISAGLMEVKKQLEKGVGSDLQKEDEVIWVPTGNNHFSIRSAWQHTRLKKNKVGWHQFIWFSQNIPKHAVFFFGWYFIRKYIPGIN